MAATVVVDVNNINADDWRRESLNEELARFRRFLRCMGILLLVWFGMLYLMVHHDNGLMIAGLVIVILWIVYMCACIVWNLRHPFQQRQKVSTCPIDDDDDDDGTHDDDDDETGGLTSLSRQDGMASSTNSNNNNNNGAMGDVFPYSFAETAQEIKACSTPVTYGIGPTNGTYTAVFSAIYFNKPIRSEGSLRLEFLATHDNGWTIQGESRFGNKNRIIQEGFVNTEGKMYWKTGDSIHRGVLDFASSCLFDGDFVPNVNQWIPSQVGPVGRIVRLELAKASFYTSNVEMVTFSRDNEDDNENRNDNTELFS